MLGEQIVLMFFLVEYVKPTKRVLYPPPVDLPVLCVILINYCAIPLTLMYVTVTRRRTDMCMFTQCVHVDVYVYVYVYVLYR